MGEDRIEDLEEGLRRILVLMEADGCHEVTERDLAVRAVALDLLDLDIPPQPFWRHH